MMLWIKQYSHPASLLAGLLVATMPIMLRYSQELRGYPLLLFATVCAYYFTSRLTTTPEKLLGYIGLAISLSVAVTTHLIGVLVIPTIVVFIVVTMATDFRKIHVDKAIVTIAIPSAIFCYLYFFYLQGLPSGSYWMPPLTLRLLSSTSEQVFGLSFLFWPLKDIQKQFPALVMPYEFFIKFLIGGIVVSLLFLGNWRRTLPLFFAATFYWLLLSLYSLTVLPIFWYRTVLPGLIPFMGFMGLQLATIQIKKIKFVSILGLFILSTIFAVVWTMNKAYTPHERWNKLSEVLMEDWRQDDLVIFYPSFIEGPVRYYFSDLPSEMSVAIDIGANVEESYFLTGDETKPLIKEDASQDVYLVVRYGASVKKDIETYDTILAQLESRFGEPTFSRDFGILSLSKYEPKQTEALR